MLRTRKHLKFGSFSQEPEQLPLFMLKLEKSQLLSRENKVTEFDAFAKQAQTYQIQTLFTGA